MAIGDTSVINRTDAVPEKDKDASSSGGFPIPLDWIGKAFDFLGGSGGKAIGQIGNLVGSVLGMGSSKKAGSGADKASDNMLKAAMADLAFRQKMYEDAQAKYGPLEQQMLGQATSNQPLGYEMLSGQMQQQYADALRRIGEQGNIGMGGLAGGAARQSQFGLATGLGNAYAQGQMNRLNLGTSLLGRSPVYGLGQNVSGGYQGLGNAYGGMFDVYNKLGMMGSAATGQALQGFGYGQGMNSGMGQTTPQYGQQQFDFTQRPSALNNANNAFSSASTYNPNNPFGNPTYPIFK